jgi:hypothetical protein
LTIFDRGGRKARTAVQKGFASDRAAARTIVPRQKSPIVVRIDKLTEELKELEPKVLKTTCRSLGSLHGVIGGKYNDYIDSVRQSFLSPQQFITEWESGALRMAKEYDEYDIRTYGRAYQSNAVHHIIRLLKMPTVRKYMRLFHERAFYRYYDARIREKPSEDLWEVWIGQLRMEYGLLITPRFVEGAGWENDVSEIRHAEFDYWTIGHVLESGLVTPDEDEPMHFDSAKDYLRFFRVTLVRPNGSQYADALARAYSDFVLAQDDPNWVPLLIPEFRYEGKEKNHKHRLDYCILSAPNNTRVGIELSPWSTHGAVKGIKKLEAAGGKKAVEAKRTEQFEKEMDKRNAYFKEFGITTLTFTDKKLNDIDDCLEELTEYLIPQGTNMPSQPEVDAEIAAYSFDD